MPVIDEQGRLFGRINVIDATIVLFVVAVVAFAGVALLLPQSAPPTDTDDGERRYATLAFNTTPEVVADEVEVNDTLSLYLGTGSLDVADVHFTPTPEGMRVYARVGYPSDDPPRTNDGAFLANTGINVRSSDYQLAGQILATNESDGTLDVGQTSVVLTGNASNATAAAIDADDELAIGEETLVSITDVSTEAMANSSRKYVRITATLETIRLGQDRLFGGHTIRVGETLPLVTDQYVVAGEVARIGSGSG